MAGVAGSQPSNLADPNPVGAAQDQAQADVVNTNIAQMAMPTPQVNAPVPAPAQDSQGDNLDDLRSQLQGSGGSQQAGDGLDDLRAQLGGNSSQDSYSALGAAAKGAEKFVTLGMSPQIHGAMSAAGDLLTGDTNIKDNYLKARDAEIQSIDQAYEQHPYAYGAGAFAGSAIPSAVAAVATGGASIPATLGEAGIAAAKVGALWGALGNPGDKVGEINPLQLGQRVANGLLGVPLGYLGGVLGYAGGKAAVAGAEAAANTKVGQAVANSGVVKSVTGMMSKAIDSIKPSAGAAEEMLTQAPSRDAGVASQLQYALQLNDQAAANGINLQPHELFPHDPDLQAAYGAALSSPEFKSAQLGRAELINKVLQNIGNSFESNGKTASEGIHMVSQLEADTGAGIGAIRQQLIDASESPTKQMSLGSPSYSSQPELASVDTAGTIANSAQQAAFDSGEPIRVHANELATKLPDIREQLGFTNGEGGTFTRPTSAQIDELANRVGAKPGQLRLFINDVAKLSDKMANEDTRLTPREMDGLRKQFQQLVDTHAPGAMDNPSQMFKWAVGLKDAARDDLANSGKVLFANDPDKMASYQAFMQRYATLKQLPTGVQKLLSKGSQATDDMVAWFESGGFAKNEQIAAFMQAAKMTSPDAAEAIGQQYTQNFMQKFSLDGGDKLRFGDLNGKAASQWLNKPTNFSRMQLVIGEDRANQIRDLANSVSAIQEANPGTFQQKMGVLKYAKAIVSIGKGDMDTAVAMLKHSQSVQKILASNPIEQFTSKLPKQDIGIFNDIINRSLAIDATNKGTGAGSQ